MQAQDMLGMSADELAEVRERSEEEYLAVFNNAQWSDWLLRVQSRTQYVPPHLLVSNSSFFVSHSAHMHLFKFVFVGCCGIPGHRQGVLLIVCGSCVKTSS